MPRLPIKQTNEKNTEKIADEKLESVSSSQMQHQQQQQQHQHQHQQDRKVFSPVVQTNEKKDYTNQRPFRIITQYGDMLVIKQGLDSSNRPCIMTFHDLGLNSDSQFSSFCEINEVKLLLKTFNFIHVNFTGQELHSETLPDDYQYPSMEELADAIVDICVQMRVRSFIGMGVGAGAYVLSLCALNRPDIVDGLFLINPVASSCSWTEWIYSKMTVLTTKSLQRTIATKPPQALGTATVANYQQQYHHDEQHHTTETTKLDNKGQQQQQNTNHDHYSNLLHQQQQQPLGQHKKMTPTARLRQLIVSKSLGKHHHHSHNKQQYQQTPERNPLTHTHSSGHDSHILDDTLGGGHNSPTGSGGRGGGLESPSNQPRLPVEYLMYHHFGPISVGRCRRLSDTGLEQARKDILSGKINDQSTEVPPGANYSATISKGSSQDDLAATAKKKQYDALLATSGQMGSAKGSGPGETRLTSSATSTTTTGTIAASITTQLASITNEKQRHAQIYSIYKGYFKRINRHNLILFTNSYLKRQTLNLRKDCGAAAHAAAAAAALGASICTPFGPASAHRATTASTGSSSASGSPVANVSHSALGPTSSGGSLTGPTGVSAAHYGRLNSASSMGSASSGASQCSCSGRSISFDSAAGDTPIHSKGSEGELSAIASTKNDLGGGGIEDGTSSGTGTVSNLDPINKGGATSPGECEEESQDGEASSKHKTRHLCGGATLTNAVLAVGTVAAQASTQVAGQHSRPANGNLSGGSLNQPVLVAGTKVKKTFSCQTLIMCSAVSTHCEQALSLMSKLNPLQSTWIKTDCLLVLEERPDKVCQALRLFLQGIGYSMSSYEKRLRMTRAGMGSSLALQATTTGTTSVAGHRATARPHHQPLHQQTSSQCIGATHSSGCAKRQSSVPL